MNLKKQLLKFEQNKKPAVRDKVIEKNSKVRDNKGVRLFKIYSDI